jgi:hypothetical protein
MKKTGLLSGEHTAFAEHLLDRLQQVMPGHIAENILLSHLLDEEPVTYEVIIDLMSPTIPFYRWYLKQASLQGTAVCNNPFLMDIMHEWTALLLAQKLGIATPRAAILPSWERPQSVPERAFSNLSFPLDWENIFQYVGFPALMMPAHQPPDESNTHFVADEKAFYRLHPLTGTQVMMLQQKLTWEAYYRCFSIGKETRVLAYHPGLPAHQRYQVNFPLTASRLEEITAKARKIQGFLGYDFQVSEWALVGNQLYAVRLAQPFHEGFLTTLPDVLQDWICEQIAQTAATRLEQIQPRQDNLNWGQWPLASIHRQAFWSWSFMQV